MFLVTFIASTVLIVPLQLTLRRDPYSDLVEQCQGLVSDLSLAEM